MRKALRQFLAGHLADCRTAFVLTSMFLAVAVGNSQAPAPPGQPVPPGWVTDGGLTVSEFNFAITAPAEWRWRRQDLPDNQGSKQRAFLAISPEGDTRYVLAVWDRRSESLSGVGSGEEKKRFLSGLTKSLPQGWTTSGQIQVFPSNVPVSGSTRITVPLTMPNGQAVFEHVYAIPGARTYMVMVFSLDETAPQGFAEFVRSFRFINPKENEKPPSVGIGLIFWLAVVGAILDWRYVRRGGVRPTRSDWVGLIVTALAGLALLVAFWIRTASPEALGEVSILVISLTLGGWELRRWFVRRQNPVLRRVRLRTSKEEVKRPGLPSIDPSAPHNDGSYFHVSGGTQPVETEKTGLPKPGPFE